LFRSPESLQAYDFLLRGLERYRGSGDNHNEEARRLFEKAVSCASRYALAHAYLALSTVAVHGFATAPADVLTAEIERARSAVELEPQEEGCHRILGRLHLFARNYDLAEHHARRASDLNPNDADGTFYLGYLLAQRGHPEVGLVWMEKAMRLNPFHSTWYDVQMGVALYSLRRFEEAAKVFARIPSSDRWTKARRAACLAQAGQYAHARADAAEVLKQRPDFSIPDFLARSILLERSEDRELLREGLIKAGLPL